MTACDLSIIIVSWNTRSLLDACLRSLAAGAGGLTLETIVVDNASSDGTPAWVAEHFPQVRLIANPGNLGFAQANNQALAVCRGRFILLLNPDTEVIADALPALVRWAEAHPEVGLIGPQLRSPDGRIQFVCARSTPTALDWFYYTSGLGRLFGQTRLFGKLMLSYWDHADSREVEALAGAAMLLPRRTLEVVGGLDESWPMYLEDLDYCARVRRAGWPIHYLASAVIVHHGGQSSQQVSTLTRLLSLGALDLFFRRYGPPGESARFRAAVIAACLVRGPIFWAQYFWAWVLRRTDLHRRRLRLEGESAALGWGLGLRQAPDIGQLRL